MEPKLSPFEFNCLEIDWADDPSRHDCMFDTLWDLALRRVCVLGEKRAGFFCYVSGPE